jgi:hypothetical protein
MTKVGFFSLHGLGSNFYGTMSSQKPYSTLHFLSAGTVLNTA